MDSLLVLTGVTGLTELVAAPAPRAADVHRPRPRGPAGRRIRRREQTDGGWSLGGWRSEVVDGELRVAGDGAVEDWWRVVAAAAWTHLDEVGEPVAPVRGRGDPRGSLGP